MTEHDKPSASDRALLYTLAAVAMAAWCAFGYASYLLLESALTIY